MELYTGSTPKEIDSELREKEKVLNYLVKNSIQTVDGVGKVMAEYYTNKDRLLKLVNKNVVIKLDNE